jgi:integrase
VTLYRHTRAEAIEALAGLRARVGPLNAWTLTVGAYLERWVRDARDIRPTTRHGYSAVVVTHLLPALGPLRLADLSPLDVEAMLAVLAPRMAPKTLRNVHVVLRRALGQAVRAGLVTRNVASREFVDPPKVAVEEPPALTPPEIERLLAVLPGHALEAHVIVALGTGLRQGEQLGLAWQDADLDAGRLTVRYELARVNGRYERVEPKTPRSRRAVPLAPPVVSALRRHRARLVERGFVPTATGPVFVNTKGGPLSGSWLTHAWYGLLAEAGVARRPWKVLRATFGSRLFAAGVADRTIADMLGHARTHTTHRHYIATGAAPADAIEAIERLVG